MRLPWHFVGTFLATALAVGCAQRGMPVPDPLAKPDPGPPAGAVAGMVLDADDKPFPGQVVAIGSRKTVSDGDGRFAFSEPGVPARYDLVIANPSGEFATVYQGLSRRDPQVKHAVKRSWVRTHQAHIQGAVLGRKFSQLAFVSPRTMATGNLWRSNAQGPGRFGPITVSWDGSDTVTGRMMALLHAGNDGIASASFGERALTLRAGDTVTVDLELAPVPVVFRNRPKMLPPEGYSERRPNLSEDYRIPGYGRVFEVDAYSSNVIDLRAFGIQLCAKVWMMDSDIQTFRTHCGFDPEERRTVTLRRRHDFLRPDFGTEATPGMEFTWPGIPDAAYHLELGRNWDDSTQRHPLIHIYSAETTVAWPDVAAAGVGFPKPLASYSAVVSAMGPYASMDALAAPGSISAAAAGGAFSETWRCQSREWSIPVYPPMSKQEAKCKDVQGIACSGTEFYQLTAINRKIRYFPEFANAMNIHCVRDCEGARAFFLAYDKYSRAHPGFDKDEPMGPAPHQTPDPPRRRGD